MTKRNRFSKATVATAIDARLRRLESPHGFRYDRGWDQVDGLGEARNRAYGQYVALFELAEKLDIMELVNDHGQDQE